MTLQEKKDKRERLMIEARTISHQEYISASDEKRANLLFDQIEKLNDEIKTGDIGNRSTTNLQRIAGESFQETATSRRTRDQGDANFRNFGELAQSVAWAMMPGSQNIDNRLREADYDQRAALGSSEAVPEHGGFLIGPTFSDAIYTKIYDENQLLNRLRKIQIGPNSNRIELPFLSETSRATGSRWGGIRAYHDNEADTITSSKPKFGKIEMSLERITALIYVTDELLQDSATLGQYLIDIASKEIGFVMMDDIINGDGSGKALGILNSAALITIDKQGSQPNTTLVAENVIKAYMRVHSPSKKRGVWLANSDILEQAMTMSIAVGTGGVPIWLPMNNLAGRPSDTLLGQPILYMEQCPTLGTAGDLLFVDPNEYLIIEKQSGAIQSAMSIHIAFDSNQTAFRFVARFNGQPLWNSSLTPFKGTNTVSPYVCIQTRS